MDRTENRQEYHDVVAQSLASIIKLLSVNENSKEARTLIIFNIQHAYTICRLDEDDNKAQVYDKFTLLKEDYEKEEAKLPAAKRGHRPAIDIDAVITKELEDMKLDDLDTRKLLAKMFAYQTLAGIKPVQTFKGRAARYAVSKGDLGR